MSSQTKYCGAGDYSSTPEKLCRAKEHKHMGRLPPQGGDNWVEEPSSRQHVPHTATRRRPVRHQRKHSAKQTASFTNCVQQSMRNTAQGHQTKLRPVYISVREQT